MILKLRQYRTVPPKDSLVDVNDLLDDNSGGHVDVSDLLEENISKKKVGGDVSKVSSQNTNLSLGGEKNPKADAGVGIEVGDKFGADPIKGLLHPLRQQYQQAQNKFNQLRNRSLSDQTQVANIPTDVRNQMFDESDYGIKMANEKLADRKLSQTQEVVKQQIGNVKIARQALDLVKQKNKGAIPKDNETAQMAQQSINDYGSLSKEIIGNKGIVGAAIDEERKNNPTFANQYNTLNGKIPRSYEGKLLYGYLQRHGENIQTFIEEHPEYKKEFDDLVNNFTEKYPETTATQIGNEVSQAYEKDGGVRDIIATLKTDDKKIDDFAAKLYKDNPERLALYNKLVKDNKMQYFKSASALNSFGGEIFSGLNSTMNAIRSATGLRDSKERAFDELDKEAQFINPNAKGIREWVNAGSGFLGMITQIASGSAELKLLGASKIGAESVPVITRFYDDELKKSEGRFGDSWKAKLSADISTALFAVGGNAIPANKMRGAVDNILKDVSEKASVSSVRERIAVAIKDGVKQYVKGVGEMTGITAAQQIVDAALGKPHENAEEELFETAKSMAMGNVAPAFLHGAGKYFGTKVERPNELNEAAKELPDGVYTTPLKEAIATGDQTKIETYLKDIAEQVSNPQSETFTRKVFGDKIADIATKLYPNAKSEPINVNEPVNQGSGEDLSKGEQGVGGELGKGVEVGTNSSGENIGNKEYADFIDKGIVSNERLSDIAEKVKTQQPLTDREKEIFHDKTKEVNSLISNNSSGEGVGDKTVEDNYESKFPKPSKPLEQLTSDELYDYAKTVKEYNKNLEKEFFGEEGAKKYREAQSISNSMFAPRDKQKEADKIIDEFHAKLTPKQENEFFAMNAPDGLIYDHTEIADIASKVSLIEGAENVNDIARSLKIPLLSFNKNKNNLEAKILFSAATKKATELGISPEELIKESIKNVAKDIPDENDREFLAKSILENIVQGSQTENTQKQLANEIPVPTEKESTPIKEPNQNIQPTSEGEGESKEPITTEPTPIPKSNKGEPPTEPPTVEGDGGKPTKGNKALANRLVGAKNVSEEAKEGIREKGLKYEPRSQKEAEQVAKSVIDEIGIDDAVDKARAQTFGGDVNTLIQTEALNRLKELEDAAKTPQEKRAYAEKFAEISIALDEWARDKAGRGIAALDYFYKKSPLGIEIAENVKRSEQFKEWSKSKEQSWKEFFDELRKEPDFEKEVQEVVSTQLKSERAKERTERKEKVHKAIDDTMAKWAKKLKAKGTDGAQKQGIGVDEIFGTAAKAMKRAYDAGEAVVKIVNDAIEYISKQLGHEDWGKEEFKKEWEQRLADRKDGKKKFTDEELKNKVLDKFRKKLKGLSDKEKEEVVKRAFKELVENGALEYDDFKKIIADVTGRGEMTPEEAKRLRELVAKTNLVDEAAKELQEKRTDAAFVKYHASMLEAAKATKDLNELLWNKPNITKRLTSIMQLNTLGIPSLVANVTYNVWNQMLARFPIGIVNDAIDRTLAGAAKLVGKNYEREYNVWETQGAFFKGLGIGAKEAMGQFLTGLNRRDLFQKEIYGQQIRPFKAMRDLFAWKFGEKKLSPQEVVDKSLQATVGIPAEVVARALNIGDKPLRFGAESVQGKAFAKALGLKEMDYKLFMVFPKEEAYRAYKSKGISDAEAAKRAEYVKYAIEQEGKRSTFQQDNLLNDLLNRMFGGQNNGAGQFIKAVTISPYIKIPSNAFWSGYNIVNPEVAFLQAMYHGARAFAGRNRGDNFSRIQLREARYWFAHGIVGIALRATIIPMVQAGIFNTANTKDDTKKEREGEQNYEQQGALNLTKMMVYLRGGDPSKVKGGLVINNRWLGQGGFVANSIARKYEDMTPEQREKQLDFWDYSFGGLEKEGLQEAQNGVFSNTSAILTALDSKGGNGFTQYLRNITSMMENTVHPAAFAQISRQQLDYVPQYKGDTFIGELKNDVLTRSSIIRKLTGQYPPAKISIWGEPLKRPDNTMMRLFGVSKTNEGNFAYPIYEDAKKTGDIGFFPPSVSPNLYGKKLSLKELNVLGTYVGQARKSLVAPYINDGAYIEGFEKQYSEIKDFEVKKKVLSYLYELGRIQGVKKFLDENPQFKKQEPSEYEEEINDNYEEFKQAVKDREEWK